jgi:hypothetical protein
MALRSPAQYAGHTLAHRCHRAHPMISTAPLDRRARVTCAALLLGIVPGVAAPGCALAPPSSPAVSGPNPNLVVQGIPPIGQALVERTLVR